MRGIISIGTHIPHYRLSPQAVGEFHSSTPKGPARSVASYDEDTSTMAVAACRRALAAAGTTTPQSLWFATTFPTYAEKSNAAVVHAALRLERSCESLDIGSSNRGGLSALVAACRSGATTLVTSADLRIGLPGSADETSGADAGAAVLVGDDDSTVIAEFLGSASITEELVDRWRIPGESRTRQWEERFGETRYGAIGFEVLDALTSQLDVSRGEIAHLVITGQSPRAVAAVTKRSGANADTVTAAIGNAGCAQPLLALSSALESAKPNDIIVVIHLSDGADAIAVRATEAISNWQPNRTVQQQIDDGDSGLTYRKFLTWRGMITIDPPRRPEPARVSSPAASRGEDWKFGFVGSKAVSAPGDAQSEGSANPSDGRIHMPPQRVAFGTSGSSPLAVDAMEPVPMADIEATIVTFTVDRLVYSQSPPVIFAIVDFDGGGRFPVELTDCRPDEVNIGDRVSMSFRRLSMADGIANYFWKATLMPSTTTNSEQK